MKHKIEYYYYPMSIIFFLKKKKEKKNCHISSNCAMDDCTLSVLSYLIWLLLFSSRVVTHCLVLFGEVTDENKNQKEAKTQSFTHSLKDINDTMPFSINKELMSFINTTVFCSQFNNWFMETTPYVWFRLFIPEFTGSWLTNTTHISLIGRC